LDWATFFVFAQNKSGIQDGAALFEEPLKRGKWFRDVLAEGLEEGLHEGVQAFKGTVVERDKGVGRERVFDVRTQQEDSKVEGSDLLVGGEDTALIEVSTEDGVGLLEGDGGVLHGLVGLNGRVILEATSAVHNAEAEIVLGVGTEHFTITDEVPDMCPRGVLTVAQVVGGGALKDRGSLLGAVHGSSMNDLATVDRVGTARQRSGLVGDARVIIPEIEDTATTGRIRPLVIVCNDLHLIDKLVPKQP
jgi:hypothetical protein